MGPGQNIVLPLPFESMMPKSIFLINLANIFQYAGMTTQHKKEMQQNVRKFTWFALVKIVFK
jgi:hypothetical protein